MNPPELPQRRRATYQREAPRKTPQARKGMRGSQRQGVEDSELNKDWGEASSGAADKRESSGDCSESKPFSMETSMGSEDGGSG